VLLIVFLGAAATPSRAAPIDRTVLALYDSLHEETPAHSMLHLNAEMPLNHLGYIVRYHDVRQGLPPLSELEGVVAIATMLTYGFEDPLGYFRWLERAAERVPRVVVLGEFGGALTPPARRSLNKVLARIGLVLTDDYVTSTVTSKVVGMDRTLVGFEADVDPVPFEHPVLQRSGTSARVALEYETNLVGGPVRSIVAATGPGGGYVASGFYLHYSEAIDSKRWIIDPFEFFRRALGIERFPVPDTTTVSGRRLYFSHVDGDGWNNLTLVERYRDPPTYSSEVMLRELIEPYPDLPVSVGFVLSDGDETLGGGEKARDVARRIFALPQVEVASHTHTHPFTWGFFEHYQRAAELRLIERQQPAEARTVAARLRDFVGLGPGEKERERRRFLAGGNDLPRAYLRDAFDVDLEVGTALRGAEELAPPDKKIALYLWSGDTRPFEAAIDATRAAGVRNMNGGDTRFDAQFPSVGYVAPLSRVAGNARQIYSVNTNENNYTGLWTERFYGQRDVIETFRRTGEPMRLRGMNVYYHTYSAERLASVNALREVLDWVRRQPVIPIRASSYAAIADGFFSSRIEAVGALEWTIGDRDGLATVRFDDAEALEADVAASDGVIGSSRHNGSLYVALDQAVATARVKLRARGQPAAGDMTQASLAGSRWQVGAVRRSSCSLGFTASGYGAGEFAWEALPATAMLVTARRGGDALAEQRLVADAQGHATFRLDIDGIEPVEIEMACMGPSQ
jgi:hypothetical protein